MHNPIKRIWVPRKPEAATPPAPVVPDTSAAVVVPLGVPPPAPKPLRNAMFADNLPEPEVVEKNSDSIWAEFDSVFVPEVERK
jgi:hypothetical protein